MSAGPFDGLSIAEVERLAERRRRAQRVGLPLTASLAEIEARERQRGDAFLDSLASSAPSGSGNCGTSVENSVDCELGDTIITAEPLPIEKVVQREVRQKFIQAGCTVYWLSQARRPGQTAGLPDLYVFHAGRGVAFWFECKRPGGQLSTEQLEFQRLCGQTKTWHVSGGVLEAEHAIARFGLRP